MQISQLGSGREPGLIIQNRLRHSWVIRLLCQMSLRQALAPQVAYVVRSGCGPFDDVLTVDGGTVDVG